MIIIYIYNFVFQLYDALFVMDQSGKAMLALRISLFLCLLSVSMLSAANQRIVVIDGALTEIVYLLGAEKNLVAVDTTSVHPMQATKLPNVGYMRALSAEGILSTKPSLIIASPSAGPKAAIDKVKAAGVRLETVNGDYNIEGLYQKVEHLGHLLNKPSQAKALNQQLALELKPMNTVLSGRYVNNRKKPKILFFLGMQGNQYMAAGGKTQADAVIKMIHADNALGDTVTGYKPLSKESVLSINPDVIIVLATQGLTKAKVYLNTLNMTTAFKNHQISVIDASILLGFGPRLPQGLKQLITVSYPDYSW